MLHDALIAAGFVQLSMNLYERLQDGDRTTVTLLPSGMWEVIDQANDGQWQKVVTYSDMLFSALTNPSEYALLTFRLINNR